MNFLYQKKFLKDLANLLEKKSNILFESEPVTLLWLAEDYVKHLEHHLKQIVEF